MRLEQIEFHRVGFWGGLPALTFGPKVTLVLGDNEAGKTTARRALEALLFGTSRELVAPLRSEQLFHASAVALLGDGSRVRWTRKGRKVEPEGVLERLPPVSWRDRFRDLFRLGHAEVRAEERTFLAESGAIGTMLFAASSGVGGTELARLRDRLQKRLKEAESRAQSGDGLRRRLQDLERLHDALKSAPRFSEHAAQFARLEEVQGIADRLTAQIDALVRRHAELLSWARGLPVWRELEELETKLARLRSAGAIPAREWTRKIKEVRARFLSARDQFETAEAHVRRAQAQFDALPPVQPWLPFLDEMERLAERSAIAEKDARELVALERERSTRLHALGEVLRSLGVSANEGELLSEAERRILPAHRRKQLEQLLADGEKRSEAKARSESELRRAEAELESSEAAAERSRPLPVDQLEQAQQVANRLSEEEARLIEVAAAEREARRETTLLLAKLGLAGDLTTVSALPVPDRAEIEARWQKWEEGTRLLETAKLRREEAEQAASKAETEVALQRERLGAPPTLEELQKAREARHAAWQQVRAAWGHDGAPNFEQLPVLAAAFELRVEQADDIADRRFADAERIGTYEAARTAWEEKASAVQKLREAEEQCAGDLAERERAWRDAWSFLKSPPANHHVWLGDYDQLVRTLADAEAAANERVERTARRDALEGEVKRLVADVLPASGELRSAEAIATAIGAELKRRREQNEQAAGAAATVETRRQQVERVKAQLEEAKAALKRWEAEWEVAIAELPKELGGERFAIEEWLDAQAKLAQLTAEVRRCEVNGKDCREALAAFDSDVSAMLARLRGLDPELAVEAGLDAIGSARAIGKLARDARELAQERNAAERTLRQAQADVEQARAALTQRKEALDACWAEGGLSGEPSDDAIEASSVRADEAHDLESALAHRRQALALYWKEGTDAALKAIAGRSEAALLSEAEAVENERKALELQKEEALREHGRITAALKELENPLRAESDAAQELANAQASVLARAEEVAALRAAVRLLDSARSRAAKGAEPLLEEASGYFATLTGGLYAGLEIDRTGDEPALLAIPASGPERTTDQLSDGTLDQIWLALRLAVVRKAALETPLPLVLDDVFVHFDDVRTSAALKLLAELSDELQIILFTHHDHVVDLAERAIPGAYQLVVLARPEQERNRGLPPTRERVERPPAPVAQFDLGFTGAVRGQAATPEGYEQLLEVLRKTRMPMSRSELIEAVREGFGVDLKPSWNALIRQLKNDGRIEQQGEKRGTRYTLARPDGETASAG